MAKERGTEAGLYSLFTQNNTRNRPLDDNEDGGSDNEPPSDDSCVITSPTLPHSSRTMHNRSVTMSSGPPSPNPAPAENQRERGVRPNPLNLSSDGGAHSGTSWLSFRGEYDMASPMMKSKGRMPVWKKWTGIGGAKAKRTRFAILAAAVLVFCLVAWIAGSFLLADEGRRPGISKDNELIASVPLTLSSSARRRKQRALLLTSHTSRTFSSLSSLASTYSPSSSPWTALVHLSNPSRIAHLESLLDSISRQTPPPLHIFVLVPARIDYKFPLSPSVELETKTERKLKNLVSVIPYAGNRKAIEALIELRNEINSDYLLFLDASTIALPRKFIQTLLRTSQTRPYSDSILSTGGIILPPTRPSSASSASSTFSDLTCLLSEGASSSSILTSATTPIHIPTTPFLLQTSWLSTIHPDTFAKDVPVEVGISLSLWTEEGIPTFILPLGKEEGRVEPTTTALSCARLTRRLSGKEDLLGEMFRRGFEDVLKDEGGAGSEKEKKGEETLSTGAINPREADGVVVLLLSGMAEVEIAKKLACALSKRHHLKIYVADSDRTKLSSRSSGDLGDGCRVELLPLDVKSGSGKDDGTFSESVHRALARAGVVEVVFFVKDGRRGEQFERSLRNAGGIMGARTEGRWNGRRTEVGRGGTVVVGLSGDEMRMVEWAATLSIDAIRHWYTPRIDLSIITNNRVGSLSRLLSALRNATYFGDSVSLTINLEQTADRATQRLTDDFEWPHGPLTLRHRIVKGGLMPAIVESWYPASNHSYGVFLEDDIEVSPMFYAWIKFAVLRYRYETNSKVEEKPSARLFGISLYQQKNIELRPEGRRPFDAHRILSSVNLPSTLPYLSQIPCSWGAIYFPEIWKEFHSYLALRLSETSLPLSETIVPAIRSNNWPRSWKKYFIELVYLRGYVMLYPNYDDFESFATNHLEKGEHIHSGSVNVKVKSQFEVPLVSEARYDVLVNGLPGKKLPEWNALPVIDLWGDVTSEKEIWERGAKTIMELDTCSGNMRVGNKVNYDAGELLCDAGLMGTEQLVVVQRLDDRGMREGGRGAREKQDAAQSVSFDEEEEDAAEGEGQEHGFTAVDGDHEVEQEDAIDNSDDDDQT